MEETRATRSPEEEEKEATGLREASAAPSDRSGGNSLNGDDPLRELLPQTLLVLGSMTLQAWKSPFGQAPLALHFPFPHATQNLWPPRVFSANLKGTAAWLLADAVLLLPVAPPFLFFPRPSLASASSPA